MPPPPAEPVLAWYSAHARDLPWRAPDASPWSVLVSEIMLQQTPVSRVLPAHRAWLARGPSPPRPARPPRRGGGPPVGPPGLPPPRPPPPRSRHDHHPRSRRGSPV